MIPGGHCCRAGWVIDNKPRLIFRNLVAKARGKKVSMANYVKSCTPRKHNNNYCVQGFFFDMRRVLTQGNIECNIVLLFRMVMLQEQGTLLGMILGT